MAKEKKQRNNDIYSAYRAGESIYSIAKHHALSWTRAAQIIKEMMPQEDRLFIVYRATNKVNGLKYIGSTIQPLPCRMAEHANSPLSALADAFNEYGFDSFVWEVVEICSNQEEMADREIFWINNGKTNQPEFGYNKTATRRRIREETTEFERKPRIIFEATPETIEKLKVLSTRLDQTVSSTARRAVMEFIAKMDKNECP